MAQFKTSHFFVRLPFNEQNSRHQCELEIRDFFWREITYLLYFDKKSKKQERIHDKF